MADNVTITANVTSGSSSNPDVTEGATVQTNVSQSTPVTGDVVQGVPVTGDVTQGVQVVGELVTGAKGDKGDTGDTGPMGPEGPQGPQGDPGAVESVNGEIGNVILDYTDVGAAATVHTHTASQVTDFDTEVSNNTDVAANTTARHTHANKVLLDTYDQTNAGIADAVAKKHSHANMTVLDNTTASFTSADETKLDGIETGADVTDATNVAAAGAFMKSVDDTDDITVGATNKFATAAEKTKLSNITVTQAVDLDTMESDLAGKQPLDTDLTDIASLAPTNDDIMQRKAGAWTNRTPVQVKTDLALTKSDVGLSNVDNTSDANKPVSTAQQTAINAKVADAINDGTTTIAPSQNAVFDALALKQPLDADLTSIAALSTTSYGRDLLTLADQAALKTTIGAATDTATGVVELATNAETTTGTDTTRATTPAGVKTVADTKQPLDATLTALAGVATAADKLIYATGPDAFTTTDLTSFARTLLDDSTAAAARSTLQVPRIASGTSSQGVGTNAKTSTIASYTLTAGDFIALTLTNGNTATAPTLNVNSGGAVTIQQTSPSPDFNAAAGAVWLLYYTGSVYVLLNNGDPVDSVYANKVNSGMDTFPRDGIFGNSVIVSQRLNLTYFTCDKIFTASQMRTITGTVAAGATPTTCKMGLYQVNADNSLTLLAKTANNTALWAATNTVYTEPFEAAGTVAMVRNQRYAFAILIDTAAATPNFQGQAWSNGNIGTYTPRLVAEVTGQTDIPSSLAAPTGVASNRPWGVVLP